MPKKTQIKFKDFAKGVKRVADENFYSHDIMNKTGSGIKLELFEKDNKIPCVMIVFHRDKYVHMGDLEKACKALRISVDSFLKVIEDL